MMPQAFDLSIHKWINAPPDAVFDAWTDASKMRRWWGLKGATCPHVEIDLRVGGAYRIDNLLPDGRVIAICGTYRIITPPSRLVYTWSVAGGPEELVELTIEPKTQGNRQGSWVTILHSGVPDRDTQSGHRRGWDDSLEQLGRSLAQTP